MTELSEEPYRGTVITIPETQTSYRQLHEVGLWVIMIFNMFVVGVLWSSAL
jgi:hypothetical protein